jgi:hypothetical protein
LLLDGFDLRLRQMLQLVGDDSMRLNFHERTSCDEQKLDIFLCTASAPAFRDQGDRLIPDIKLFVVLRADF